uniref:Uncharacterized protein n=1 Tax=Rhodnius prolixus TaxID=13249 RepID=T1HFH2_RHOPR
MGFYASSLWLNHLTQVKFLASGLDFTIILHVQQALYASLNIILAFGIAQNDISFD